ncbi:hypothetical protein GCM10011391_24050 [Pullulanibacillus camelliae]|uniref:Uncharacterized protein n=1 Tax=Pullulanibacillus camelliae TaxID=1707096 RepID=A0A8J2YI24_9BACL|nr:hypothetical protein [Pullulanibacillus camelliae]GGE44445.1 hypothetical protein GCM10011391_24050 [Pullulanibacillus camelliae]
MVFILYLLFALFILYTYNYLVNRLCTKNKIPEQQQKVIYSYVNVSAILLLLCMYYNIKDFM